MTNATFAFQTQIYYIYIQGQPSDGKTIEVVSPATERQHEKLESKCTVFSLSRSRTDTYNCLNLTSVLLHLFTECENYF